MKTIFALTPKDLRILFALSFLLEPALGAQLLDGIAAVVEDQVITLTELHQRTETFLKEQKGPIGIPSEQLERQILEQMILETLQLKLAARKGIEVSDEELQRALVQIARKNGMELPQFREALIAQGISYPQFVQWVRKQLLLPKLYRYLLQTQVEVSEEEIDHFLATERDRLLRQHRYRVGHILIATGEKRSPEEILKARHKAERLVEELRRGLDFAQAAIALSADRYALKGGDLGWRRLDQLPTLMVDIVPKLERGEVYGPIQSPSGFHIIKLLDVEEEGEDRFEFHLRHILVKTDPVTTDQKARALLEAIREKILGGEDFGALARLFSEDPSTAPEGGDLGWVKEEDLEPEFIDLVTRLGQGEISRPFKTSSGWHLVQLVAKRERRDDEEILRQRARKFLVQRKWQETLGRLLQRLRQQANVEVLVGG